MRVLTPIGRAVDALMEGNQAAAMARWYSST
jgi:hypothetical protein